MVKKSLEKKEKEQSKESNKILKKTRKNLAIPLGRKPSKDETITILAKAFSNQNRKSQTDLKDLENKPSLAGEKAPIVKKPRIDKGKDIFEEEQPTQTLKDLNNVQTQSNTFKEMKFDRETGQIKASYRDINGNIKIFDKSIKGDLDDENHLDLYKKLAQFEIVLLILKELKEKIENILHTSRREGTSTIIAEHFHEKGQKTIEFLAGASGAFYTLGEDHAVTSGVDLVNSVLLITSAIEITKGLISLSRADEEDSKAQALLNKNGDKEEYKFNHQQATKLRKQGLTKVLSGSLSGAANLNMIASGALHFANLAHLSNGFVFVGIGIGMGASLIAGTLATRNVIKGGAKRYQISKLVNQAKHLNQQDPLLLSDEQLLVVQHFAKFEKYRLNSKIGSNLIGLGICAGGIMIGGVSIGMLASGTSFGISIPVSIGLSTGLVLGMFTTKIAFDVGRKQHYKRKEKKLLKTNPAEARIGALLRLQQEVIKELINPKEENFFSEKIVEGYIGLNPKVFILSVEKEMEIFQQKHAHLHQKFLEKLDRLEHHNNLMEVTKEMKTSNFTDYDQLERSYHSFASENALDPLLDERKVENIATKTDPLLDY